MMEKERTFVDLKTLNMNNAIRTLRFNFSHIKDSKELKPIYVNKDAAKKNIKYFQKDLLAYLLAL